MARPYPIVVMFTSFDVGGTERQTVELVRRLDPRLFQVHVACFHARGPLLSAVPETVPVEAFQVQGFRNPASAVQWLRFARWCRERRVRLVHTCDLYANLFGLTAAALARVPARIGSRREVITGDKSPLQLLGQRIAYRTAHAVLANSSAAAQQLEHEGVTPDRIRLIPNGVDLTPFSVRRPRRPIRRIVTVANLRAEKGHDVLIDAAPHVLAAHPDAEFLIAGDGPMAGSLAARAEERGVSGRMRFLGRCDDVPALLGSCDLFVLPSRSEALPNAVIEAMAASLPIVATQVGGIPELITPGLTGTLVPAGDAAALAHAIVDLMARPDHAARLGSEARARAEAEYGFPRMVDSVQRMYLAEIQRRERAAAMETAAA